MNQESRIKRIKAIIHYSLFIIRKSQKGFTLIELLVAISIIGILSSFLLANFIGVRQRARDGVRKSDLRQIQSALELYRSDKGGYPSSFPPCTTVSPAFTDGGSPSPIIYMQKIPCDPSSTSASPISYTYSSPAGNATYTIIACLENGNDSQKDNPTNSVCSISSGRTGISYTLQNP